MAACRGEGPHVFVKHDTDLALEPERRVVHRCNLVSYIVVFVHSVLPIDPVGKDPPVGLYNRLVEVGGEQAEELLLARCIVDWETLSMARLLVTECFQNVNIVRFAGLVKTTENCDVTVVDDGSQVFVLENLLDSVFVNRIIVSPPIIFVEQLISVSPLALL